MKKIALLIVSILFIFSSTAYSAPYRAPIKRLTADEIFALLAGVRYGRDIAEMSKVIGSPAKRFDDNWTWEHQANGSILRVYFTPANIIYRAAIQEFAQSAQDSIGRTEILAGQYERRFGRP